MRKDRTLIKSETPPFGKRWSKRATLRDVLVGQMYNSLPNFQIL
jgi:hypothetical protein